MGKVFERFPFTLKEDTCKGFLERAYMQEAGITELDDAAKGHIMDMCQWLINSDKWGVMLMGSVGNGKTTLMKATVKLLKTAYSNTLTESGIPMMVSMSTTTAKDLTNAARKGAEFNNNQYMVCAIDDMGEEPTEVMSFGNVITPITDIMEERYAKRQITIITTNLDANGIKNKYGERVADRLRQMVRIITFTNPSYR